MEFETGNDLIGLKESLSMLPEVTEWPTSDLDPDEYARNNDLTVDSLRDPWPACLDDRVLVTLPLVEDGCLVEIEGLRECLFREVIPAPEQLQMPASSLKLIQEAYRTITDTGLAGLMAELRSTMSSQPKPVSKFEVPVLRTDHEADCRQLARRIAMFRRDQIADHRLPLHPVNEEMGEGLDFSEKAKRGDEEVMKSAAGDSLEMTRETFIFLSQCLREDLAESDKRTFLDEAFSYKGVRGREHLTPPLSPQLPPLEEYFVPDDETCEIPVLSSDNDAALSAELDAAESNIFKNDIQFWATAVSQQIPSPERYNDLDIAAMIKAGDLSGPSPLSSPKPPPRSLKIDVPLLPASSNTKDENPARVLTADDLAQAKTFIDSSDTLSAGPGDRDEQFAEFLRSKAASVMRLAEQEKLQPLDATLRMPVRVMDFSLPAPDWATCSWHAADMYRWIQKATDTVWQSPKWPANKTVEQRMVWRPLAHMDRMIVVTERMDCDPRVLSAFLGRPSEDEVWMSEDLVEKNLELAFRRPRDDCDSEIDVEEDIYAGLDSPSMPEVSHGRLPCQPENQPRPPQDELRRSMQSSNTMAPQSLRLPPTQPPTHLQDLSTLLRAHKRSLDEMEQQRRPSVGSTSLLTGFLEQHVDSAPLIDNFIQISTSHKRPKLTHSSFFSSPTPPTTTTATLSRNLDKEEAARLMPPPPKPIPAFSPHITPPATPPKVIISFAVSKHLVQHIKTALPNLILIERNYNPHPQPSTNIPMDEADITISPATGLLFTTMVKLRQKPIPGSGSSDPFRHLITIVATRYERLVVLVSEGNKHSETMSPLSQSDAKALAEAQGFAAALADTANVQLLYVGGGVETLARWAAHVICRYAPEAAAEQKLVLPVETGWELFLRRAGMNVYAAQVSLGRLKVPDGEPAMGGGKRYGLPLFVGMSAEERVRQLGSALGGRRVLERVGRVVDGGWHRHGAGVGQVVHGSSASLGGYAAAGTADTRRVAYGTGASPGGYRGAGT